MPPMDRLTRTFLNHAAWMALRWVIIFILPSIFPAPHVPRSQWRQPYRNDRPVQRYALLGKASTLVYTRLCTVPLIKASLHCHSAVNRARGMLLNVFWIQHHSACLPKPSPVWVHNAGNPFDTHCTRWWTSTLVFSTALSSATKGHHIPRSADTGLSTLLHEFLVVVRCAMQAAASQAPYYVYRIRR
ncbi:hypothetical protein BC835DRAFT_87630 [Cytidiella melzeri]|nr:hypothetical protein BC835DRAFT_87630 [Cytidiella melzeri]